MKTKLLIGVLGLILGFLLWVTFPGIGLINVIFALIPAILLIIPSETVKNSKILGIIFILLLLYAIFSLNASYNYIPGDLYTGVAGNYAATETAITFQIILCIYGLFCAFLLLIESEHKQADVKLSTRVISNNNAKKFDKYCSECGHGLFKEAKFCPRCGAKVQINMSEPENSSLKDNEDKHCKKCGQELEKDSLFCPECGTKVTDSKNKES